MKWHRTRRLHPIRVGRHWLVLVIATWLAVASGTRREEAEARHRRPGRRRRPPAGNPLGVDAARQDALPPRRHSLLQQGVVRLSMGLHVAATYARPRLPHAPAPGTPRRHLNLPAPTARDPHHTTPTLSPHPGRLGPPHSAARHTRTSAPTGPFCPHTAGDSHPSRAWPCRTSARSTVPDASANFRPENTLVKGWSLSCVLAGAVLADLALEQRIDTDLESLVLADATATVDDVLEPVLAEIAAETDTQQCSILDRKDCIAFRHRPRTGAGPTRSQKILNRHLGGFWTLSRNVAASGQYPAGEGVARVEVKTRIFNTIFEDTNPDPRDVIIIGLVNACDAFRFLLTAEDYQSARERINLISNMDLVSQAIATAVAESSIRLTTMVSEMTKPIPTVNPLKMLGKKSLWHGNLAMLMTELYKEYGPVLPLRPHL